MNKSVHFHRLERKTISCPQQGMIIVPGLRAEEEEEIREALFNILYYRIISYVILGILNINMIPGIGGYPNLTLVCTIIGVHCLKHRVT